MTRRLWAAAIAVCASITLVAAGCGGGGGGSSTTTTTPPGQNGWTVLVYVVADNDLEPFALLDLQEMAAVGSAAGVRIVAQVDRSPAYSSDGVLNIPNWSGGKRFLVQQGSLQELASAGTIDSAASAVLADFIQWGVRAYPAPRTMLVLWDHGGAWQGFGVDQTNGTGQHLMAIPDIATGVHNGLVAAGIARFDVLGFDACLMASIEVAEALGPYASYLLVSEESEPGHGWDYASLQVASATPTVDAPTLSRAIADGFLAQATSAQWNDAASVTLSVIDTSRIAAIDTALGAFQTALQGNPGAATAVAQARAATLEFGQQPDPAASFQMVDLGDLFAHVAAAAGGQVATAAAAVRSAVDAAVVYQVKGTAKAAAHGLSAYFPPDAALYQAAYDNLAGIDAWRNVVKTFENAAGTTAVPAFVGGSGALNAQPASVSVSGDLDPGSLAAIASTTVYYGIPGSGANDAWLLGDQPGSATAGTGTVGADSAQGGWDYSVMTLSQGAYQELAYLSIVQTPASCAAYVPFEYQEGATSRGAVWEAIFTCATGTITSSTFYVQSAGGAFGPLSPTLGSRLYALAGYVADIGTAWTVQWARTGTTGFDATSTGTMVLGFTAVSTNANFTIALKIDNAAGDGSWIYANGVPRP